jgi:hypothetical protein
MSIWNLCFQKQNIFKYKSVYEEDATNCHVKLNLVKKIITKSSNKLPLKPPNENVTTWKKNEKEKKRRKNELRIQKLFLPSVNCGQKRWTFFFPSSHFFKFFKSISISYILYEYNFQPLNFCIHFYYRLQRINTRLLIIRITEIFKICMLVFGVIENFKIAKYSLWKSLLRKNIKSFLF